MHILFVHQNFPAQFGHIAAHLTKQLGWRCTFVSERTPGIVAGIERIQYKREGGASKHNSYYTRNFETCISHADAVYAALKSRPDIQPDLIVGHSGFGSTIFLREILDCPTINFFEYYYRPHLSDMDFRPDSPVAEKKYLRSRVRNAMILLDLQNCDAGYTPTEFQRNCFPDMYQRKLHTIFDGVDTRVYRRLAKPRRQWGKQVIGPNTRIVTYCSRGFEKMRGFDVFMKAAKRIYQQYPDVVFLVAGTDRVCYGGDKEQIQEQSLRHHLLNQDDYDISKFIFVGWVQRPLLAQLLSLGDAHIYLTVPFVLSWSMMNAMSCGALVVGSKTEPVEEMVSDGQNGFLVDFFDHEAFADRVVRILKDPPAYDAMRKNAMRMIHEQYSLDVMLPKMIGLYEGTIAKPNRDPTLVSRGNTSGYGVPGETPQLDPAPV